MLYKKMNFNENDLDFKVTQEEHDALMAPGEDGKPIYRKDLEKITPEYLEKLKNDPSVTDKAAYKIMDESGILFQLKLTLRSPFYFHYSKKDPEKSRILIWDKKESISFDELKTLMEGNTVPQAKIYGFEQVKAELLRISETRRPEDDRDFLFEGD